MCLLESINDGLEYTGTLCINRLRFDIEATLVTSGSHRVWPVPTSLESCACLSLTMHLLRPIYHAMFRERLLELPSLRE